MKLTKISTLSRSTAGKATSSRRVVFQIPRIVVNMSASASHHPANKAVEKAIVDKGLGKKCAQYSNVASSFVLFHVARASRMVLPHACGGCFGVKHFPCPSATTKFFQHENTWKFATQTFSDLWYNVMICRGICKYGSLNNKGQAWARILFEGHF